MKVLFIYPDICTASGRFQEGIGYISGVLKHAGHETALMHIEKEISREDLWAGIEKESPDIIGFSATTNQYPYVAKYAGWAREKFAGYIICGGVHPTLSPDDVIAHKGIDIICIGEGEYPLLELVQNIESGGDITGIANLWVKKDGEIYRNPLRPLIDDLDSLPFPDRDLFKYKEKLARFAQRAEGLLIAEVMSSRGCPFKCTYCCNHALSNLFRGLGSYMRRRSVDNVLNEIGELVDKYDINWLIFDDDTFTLNPEWIKEFCLKYPQRFQIPFQCNAFPSTINEEVVQRLKEAGCVRVAVGIESGNEWLRQEVLHRPLSDEHIINAFKLLSDAGIKCYSFNMVGFPYETTEMMQDTVNLNLKLNPDHIQASIFYPYPGTELYELCRKEGYLGEGQKSSYFQEGTVLDLPNLSVAQINSYFRRLHTMSIDRIVRDSYPRLYPFYNLIKKVMGERITYRLSMMIRKILYGY